MAVRAPDPSHIRSTDTQTAAAWLRLSSTDGLVCPASTGPAQAMVRKPVAAANGPANTYSMIWITGTHIGICLWRNLIIVFFTVNHRLAITDKHHATHIARSLHACPCHATGKALADMPRKAPGCSKPLENSHFLIIQQQPGGNADNNNARINDADVQLGVATAHACRHQCGKHHGNVPTVQTAQDLHSHWHDREQKNGRTRRPFQATRQRVQCASSSNAEA